MKKKTLILCGLALAQVVCTCSVAQADMPGKNPSISSTAWQDAMDKDIKL